MAKLIMCKGLPGSGKSTWAADQVLSSQMRNDDASQWWTIVNRDKIRRNLETTGWSWSFENEKDVVLKRDYLIRNALADGRTVISDDTNMSHKHKVQLEALAREFGADFEVKDFTNLVTVEECIRRDSLRQGKAKVGEKVITDMANRYHIANREEPVFQPVQQTVGLPTAIICDLDGTLALFNGKRSPYDASTCEQDEVNEPIAAIIEEFYASDSADILYVSGREDKYRDATERWLRKSMLPAGPLYMRTTGDHRKDWIVKGEIFDAHIRHKYNVLFCLDDRDQVVKFWRSIGLTCLQVTEGNF